MVAPTGEDGGGSGIRRGVVGAAPYKGVSGIRRNGTQGAAYAWAKKCQLSIVNSIVGWEQSDKLDSKEVVAWGSPQARKRRKHGAN